MGHGDLIEKVFSIAYNLVPLAQIYCFFIIVVSLWARL